MPKMREIVNGHTLKIELDTGSAISTLPLETYKETFPNRPLVDTTAILKTYSGDINWLVKKPYSLLRNWCYLITTTIIIIIIIMIIYLISTSGLWASETDMVIACLTPAIPINTPTFILFAILLNTQPCIFFPIALLPSLWCSFILEKCLFSVSLLYENNQHLKNDSKDGEGPL